MQAPLVYHVSNNTFGKFQFLALKISENVIHPEKEKKKCWQQYKLDIVAETENSAVFMSLKKSVEIATKWSYFTIPE